MTKGGSGCLFREKLIERASNKVIIVCDDSKIYSSIYPDHVGVAVLQRLIFQNLSSLFV